MMDARVCRRCNETKPIDDFYRRKDSKSVSHFSWCKVCQRKITAANSHARYNTVWPKNLAKLYGISVETYADMSAAQKGLCAICNQPDKVRLGVDHCHKTKKVRALLCRNCNLMIGLAKDQSSVLVAAAYYLNRHE